VVGEFVAHDSRLWFRSLNHGSAAELNFRFGGRQGVESGQHALVMSISACDPKRTRGARACRSVVSFNDNQWKPVRELPFRGEIAVSAWVTLKESVLLNICESGLHLSFPKVEPMC